jgi:hypothetical protein
MRKTLSALLWYVVHLGVLGAAFIFAGPLHIALPAVVPVTVVVVGVMSSLQALAVSREFDLPLLIGVGGAAFSLSIFLLLIDWAAASNKRELTVNSFAHYLRIPVSEGDLMIGCGPALLLLTSSIIGLIIGHAVRKKRTS